MSAVPVFIPHVAVSPAHRCEIRRMATTARTATAPAQCQLTDRGIAVVIAVAAIIMIAALAVIGMTVVRVTGAGYATAVQGARQAH